MHCLAQHKPRSDDQHALSRGGSGAATRPSHLEAASSLLPPAAAAAGRIVTPTRQAWRLQGPCSARPALDAAALRSWPDASNVAASQNRLHAAGRAMDAHGALD